MKLGRWEKKAMVSGKHAIRGVAHIERLMPYVELRGKRKYLEIGCGNGHVCRHVADKYGLKSTGTDVDPEMIRLAKESSNEKDGLSFLVADATELPFQDGSFDMVLSFGVLHHIRKWKKVLDEVNRVLKPGGNYIYGDLSYSRFTVKIFKPIAKKYGFYTVDDIVNAMENNNFRVIYREKDPGMMMKYYSIIFEKLDQSDSSKVISP